MSSCATLLKVSAAQTTYRFDYLPGSLFFEAEGIELGSLLPGLHQSCLPHPEPSFKVAETSFLHRVFGGKLRSQIKCQDYVSNTYEPFLDLSLEISRADSLEAALKRFTAPEVLDGPNKYYCEKYKKRMKANKRFTIDKAPPVLAVHLKRFDYTRNFGYVSVQVAAPTYALADSSVCTVIV